MYILPFYLKKGEVCPLNVLCLMTCFQRVEYESGGNKYNTTQVVKIISDESCRLYVPLT